MVRPFLFASMFALTFAVGCGNKDRWGTSGVGDDTSEEEEETGTTETGNGGDDSGETGGGGTDQDRDGDGHESWDFGGDDCDDSDATVHPGADDACGDQIDTDCDDDPECDCDGDGFSSVSCDGNDCEDTDAAIHPGATDECYDGLDADCGGEDDADCDGDGYASDGYGGDDCDDTDASVSPGADDECYDGFDADCAGNDDDDCDEDGYTAVEAGGDDCDDTNPDVYPFGDETGADGFDSDCDGETDEDAYCNRYSPLSNGSSATREYSTLTFDGGTYTETVTIDSWDASTGEATLGRTFTGGTSGGYDVDQDVVCDDSGLSSTGYVIASSGYTLGTVTYTSPRTDLLPEDEMTEGASWSYSYDAEEPSYGLLYTAEGTMTVIGTESVTVPAGTFDALRIENAYQIVDENWGYFGREGVATYWYVERLGLVYSEDRSSDGSMAESREMQSYSGFYP